MTINVIGQPCSVFQNNSFYGLNMSPGGLVFEEIGIEEFSGIVVEGCNEMPLFLGVWRPEVVGGVVLEDHADCGCLDNSVMLLGRRFGCYESPLMRSVSNCLRCYCSTDCPRYLIAHCCIVILPD